MYRFLAVLESWTYRWGYCVGSASSPSRKAIVSAVLMLVSDAPIIGVRYVTRVRIGFIGAFIHAADVRGSGEFMLSRHSVAVAVIIELLIFFQGWC